ncbi:MAG TPA: glycoside hydrolase family 19 protein [Candidatus Paceibacterota bacterium]
MNLSQLTRIMPFAKSRAATFLQPLNVAMQEFGIDTVLRQSAFLAQVAVESGQLRYVVELASGVAYNNRKDLGNTTPEAIAIAKKYGNTPGPWLKGRGLIQVTGYYNYLACGKALGLDLLNRPVLLEEPMNAARSAGWYWKTNNLNKWADIPDFDGVCDMTNKGRKTTAIGDALGYQLRLATYTRALPILKETA